MANLVEYIPGGGNVFTASLTLTSAQLLALVEIPVQVVAAPGAGMVINPITSVWKYHFGTTPYTINGAQIVLTTPPVDVSLINIGMTGFLDQSNDYIQFSALLGSSANTTPIFDTAGIYENQPLVVGNIGSDLTAGDGTLEVTVLYQIVTF